MMLKLLLSSEQVPLSLSFSRKPLYHVCYETNRLNGSTGREIGITHVVIFILLCVSIYLEYKHNFAKLSAIHARFCILLLQTPDV